MSRKRYLFSLLLLLAGFDAGQLPAAECLIEDNPKPRRIALPPPPPHLKLAEPKPEEETFSPAISPRSEQFSQQLIAESDSIFTAKIVEVIGANAFTQANDNSRNFLAHVWVKQGWKKPKRRKLDLEVDFNQTACKGAFKVKLNFYDTYLFYLSGEKVLTVLPLKQGQPSSKLGIELKQKLGEEDWYYNRVDNLVMLSNSL